MSADDPVLFQYALATAPQPLQAGSSAIAANGTISVHIAAPGTPAFADAVAIAVPVGPDGLFQDPPVCTLSTGKWTVARRAVKPSDVGVVGAGQPAVFLFDCRDAADYGIDYNFVIALTGAVTGVVGDYQITVAEHSGTTSDPSTFTFKNGSYTVAVMPPELYLSNLFAYANGSPTVPASEFAAGTDINLAWTSNGTWFQLFKKGDTQAFWAGTATTYQLQGGVDTDTTFFLIASMTGDPRGDSSGFAPVILIDSVAISISNPLLTPTSVTTSGEVSVGGVLSVPGVSTLGTVEAGTLNTSGLATLATASVTGDATVSGFTTLASAHVTGALFVEEGATIFGGLTGTSTRVSLMNAPIPLQPGGYSAPTDGFVIGVVSWPGSVIGLCQGFVFGWTDGMSLVATGGNMTLYYSIVNQILSAPNAGSFIMPVRRDATFSVNTSQSPLNQQTAPTSLYWMPMGSGGVSMMPERISDETPPMLVGPPPQVRPPAAQPKQALVAELADVLVAITGRPVPADLHQRLEDVLTRLNAD